MWPKLCRHVTRCTNLLLTSTKFIGYIDLLAEASWIARVGSALQRAAIDGLWLLGRGRVACHRRERLRPWPLPPSGVLPSSGGHVFTGGFCGRACTRRQHLGRSARGQCSGARLLRVRVSLLHSSDLLVGRGTGSLTCGSLANLYLCSAWSAAPMVVSLCDDLCMAAALVLRRLEDGWLSLTCSSMSCLARSATHGWILLMEKFRVSRRPMSRQERELVTPMLLLSPLWPVSSRGPPDMHMVLQPCPSWSSRLPALPSDS